jgi:hypothetical protein
MATGQANQINKLATSATRIIIDKAPLNLSRFVAANRSMVISALEVEVIFALEGNTPSIHIPNMVAREYIEAAQA